MSTGRRSCFGDEAAWAALSGRLGKCAQKSSTRHPSRILFALRGASSLAGASSSPCLAAHGGGRRSRQAEKTAQELRSGRRRAVAGVRWRRWPPCPPAGTACSTPPPSSRLPPAKRRVLTPPSGRRWVRRGREQSAGSWSWSHSSADDRRLELWALRCSSVARNQPNARQRQVGAGSAPLHPPKRTGSDRPPAPCWPHHNLEWTKCEPSLSARDCASWHFAPHLSPMAAAAAAEDASPRPAQICVERIVKVVAQAALRAVGRCRTRATE